MIWRGRHSHRRSRNPIANNVCEFGVGFAATTATPTDGVYFKLNTAGVLVGVMNINGTETTTAPMPSPVAGQVSHYRIVIDQDRIEFFIAYSFFALYAVVKVMQFSADLPWLLWTEEDQAIFAGIISFYFGQRAMTKVRGGK